MKLATNLTEANLFRTNLTGAKLFNTNLTNVRLEYATLPDGNKWNKDLDPAQYTDPDHSKFWDYVSDLFDDDLYSLWQLIEEA